MVPSRKAREGWISARQQRWGGEGYSHLGLSLPRAFAHTVPFSSNTLPLSPVLSSVPVSPPPGSLPRPTHVSPGSPRHHDPSPYFPS